MNKHQRSETDSPAPLFLRKNPEDPPTQPYSKTKTVILASGTGFQTHVQRIHQNFELLLTLRGLLLYTNVDTFRNNRIHFFPFDNGKTSKCLFLFLRIVIRCFLSIHN